MASVLNEAYFTDEGAAFAALEGIMWPDGPVCPHCGGMDKIGKLDGVKDKKGRVRPGLWKCYQPECRKQFTVRKGTVFESSHLKLHQWFQATYLLCSSKKGCSSNQIARTLGITVKSAWFATHRIREAMRQGDLAVPFGSGGGAVESDETYIGRKKGFPKRRAFHHKMGVLTLIDRDTKQARSQVITDVKHRTIAPILRKNIAREARLMTDEAGGYRVVGQHFAQHGFVRHGKDEYVHPDDPSIHTNTAEGYFSVFKRGMKGVYQHCSEQHLHRYLAEFDFRYNHRQRLGIGDTGRTVSALRGSAGKRLMYKDS